MKLLLLLNLCFGLCCSLFAQGSTFDLERFKLNVKQPEEFMQRFNAEKDTEDQSIAGTLSRRARGSYIFSLFDENYIAKARQDSSLMLQINRFILEVTDTVKPQYLAYTSPHWFAAAQCQAVYRGKPSTATYILKTETDTMQASQWKIVAAHSPLFSIDTAALTNKQYISGVAHNLNFTKLSWVLNNSKNNPLNFAYTGYRPDALAVALFASKQGLLELKSVQELSFYFLNIAGWGFQVEYFERDSDNAGWLIALLKPMTAGDKRYFLIHDLGLDKDFVQSLFPISKATKK